MVAPIGRHPHRYLHAAAWDVLFAILAGGVHFGFIPLGHPVAERIPGWLWPALMALFLFTALWSYGRHRRLLKR